MPARQQRPLNRERVLRAAIGLADAHGLEAVTMRRLGQALGVEAMSLYNHVHGKDDLVDGMLSLLLDGIPRVPERPDWRGAVREQALAARSVVLSHRWLRTLVVERTAGSLAILRYLDWLVGLLQAGGLSNQLIHDGVHVLGSRTLGFAQDIFDPEAFQQRVADGRIEVRPEVYPRMFRALDGVHHRDDEEFAFGLDLILDGLEARRVREARAADAPSPAPGPSAG